MKYFLSFLLLFPTLFAADAANEVIFAQRPSNNIGPSVQRNVLPTAGSVAGYDGSLHPTTYAASVFGRAWLNYADAAAGRTGLGLGSLALLNAAPAATLTGNLVIGSFNSGTGASSSTYWRGDGTWAAGGSGTVTTLSIVTANGVSGTVANPTTTPAVTLALGAITPSSVAASGTVTGSNLSGTNTGDQTSVTGNAGTATALQTARTINGVSFDGTANITVAAAAGTLTGATLASGVTASSLLSAGGGTFGTAAFVNTTAFEVPLTFSTGLTRLTNTVTVNTSQNIAKLSNLVSNGFVKTSAGDGTLGIDTTTYLPTSIVPNTAPTAGQLLVGNAGGTAYVPVSASGDLTVASTGAHTLATVNGNVGTFGSATATATVTLNAKGLATAGSNTTVTPAIGSITGLGTGVATAAAINVGSAGAVVVNGGALGTPSSGTATNLSGTAASLAVGSAAALSVSGQTGLVTVTGLASTNRVKTVRDAADTLLELGGSYTPTGTWTNLTLVTPALGTPASGTLDNTTTATASAGDNSTKPASTAYADRSAWTMPPNAQTASFTFVIADQFRVTTISNASANTATIPPHSSVAFPPGTTLILMNLGAGQCTWTQGSGVTIVGRASAYKTAGQYAPSYAWQGATQDTWIVSGDVTP